MGKRRLLKGNVLSCNTALGTNAKGLEYFLSIGCVERIIEPARGMEIFRMSKVMFCAIGHGLIDSYLGLTLKLDHISLFLFLLPSGFFFILFFSYGYGCRDFHYLRFRAQNVP